MTDVLAIVKRKILGLDIIPLVDCGESLIMGPQFNVMISSTIRDLPEHRKLVMDACLRQRMFPLMMEHLPANDADAISTSLRLVSEANIYVLIIGYRYSYVPKDQLISITEMEYNRAVELNIPRLVFLMHEDHLIRASDVELGEGAIKLENFKTRLKTENIVNFFKSPEGLRADVINGLSQYRRTDPSTFHYTGEIPIAPEAFVAHPYTLMQTHQLVGRTQELKLLTDWIKGKELIQEETNRPVGSVTIVSIVAFGGIGKSALTWNWFNEIVPLEMKLLAGRIWWSFYESDATFENLIMRALAYTTKRPLDEVVRISAPEREMQLLAALEQRPFLLVLDGLERLLIAYSRTDAARLPDQSVGNRRRLRRTTDSRVGRFLRKLAQVTTSRVLITSRLSVAELENEAEEPIPRTFKIHIKSLTDEEAIALWHQFGISGSRHDVLEVLKTFDKHPLLIQALAGEIKTYHRAPGNFEAWRKVNDRFDPHQFLRLQEAMGHVLEFVLRGISGNTRHVLNTIAAFRMPTGYDTLVALLVKETGPCADEAELDAALTDLEDRGLLGWDRRGNRFDLHPIVRAVTWSAMEADIRQSVHANLHRYFSALPASETSHKVNSLDDLTTAIELYNTLISLGRYDDARTMFHERLLHALLYRLNASREVVELLEMLFPDGLDRSPRLLEKKQQGYTYNTLALGYTFSGQPLRAIPLLRRASSIASEIGRQDLRRVALTNLAAALRHVGELRETETTARRAWVIASEQGIVIGKVLSLQMVGLILGLRGMSTESETILGHALKMSLRSHPTQLESQVNYSFAQRALWLGEFTTADHFVTRMQELARTLDRPIELIRTARIRGEVLVALGHLVTAEEQLHYAVVNARKVNLVQEELPALVALAELQRQQGDLQSAREFLDDVWDPAQRGPYVTIQADAFNVLTQIEIDVNNQEAAIQAATRAYHLAWCDGPPFAYQRALEASRTRLTALGVSEPNLLKFDDSNLEPIPVIDFGDNRV